MPIPRVDVVIPVYNGATTVESAIASILAQTVPEIRVIVVNDGSTDETRDILRRIAAGDPRVEIFDQKNSGVVDALNAGLRVCRADLIARHDADDLASPDRFERQLLYLRDHPDCIAVSGAVRRIDQAGRPMGGVVHLPSPDLSDFDWYPQREPYLVHPFLMMRRGAAEKIGGYRYAFHAEDTDLYWRLQEIGQLANLPDLMGEYRIHADSVTGSSAANGRISATNSQRAGLSAKRRRSGRPDIDFPKSALEQYRAAHSLEGVIAVGTRDLDRSETQQLARAACAKMLDLAGYRSYELEPEDCDFIRRTIVPALSEMKPDNRQYCARMLSGTAARLARAGHIAAAFQLAPARLYPPIAARLALRTVVPSSVLAQIRDAVGRPSIAK